MVFPSSPGKLFKIIPIGDLGAIKNFKDMATEKNSKGSVKNFFSACWKVVENIGKGILITIILIGMILFWFNPIFFLPISLLAPKAAADSLYDLDIEIFSDFWRAFYQPWVALLPMRWKKHFMAVRGISEYSPCSQVKYYRNVAFSDEEKQDVVGKMSSEATDLLWKKGSDLDRIILVKAGYRPNMEQLERLNNGVLDHVLHSYLRRYTPSDELLEMMMRHELKPYFISSAEKSGLSARVINKVFQDKDEKFVENVKQALQRYSERQVVLRTQNMPNLGEKEWKLFLKDMEGKEITPAAQKAMKLWQYIEYHDAGFMLAPMVIEYFLSYGVEDICARIFTYEPDESFTDKAKAFVAANPKLKSLQMNHAGKENRGA